MNVEQIRWNLNSAGYSERFCGWWIRSGRDSEWALIVIASAVRVGYVWN